MKTGIFTVNNEALINLKSFLLNERRIKEEAKKKFSSDEIYEANSYIEQGIEKIYSDEDLYGIFETWKRFRAESFFEKNNIKEMEERILNALEALGI